MHLEAVYSQAAEFKMENPFKQSTAPALPWICSPVSALDPLGLLYECVFIKE